MAPSMMVVDFAHRVVAAYAKDTPHKRHQARAAPGLVCGWKHVNQRACCSGLFAALEDVYALRRSDG